MKHAEVTEYYVERGITWYYVHILLLHTNTGVQIWMQSCCFIIDLSSKSEILFGSQNKCNSYKFKNDSINAFSCIFVYELKKKLYK